MAKKNNSRPQNRLLQLLPARELERLKPELEAVELEYKFVIAEPRGPMPYVYFVESGVVSMMALIKTGAALEVATVGREGTTGVPVFLGSGAMPLLSIVQIPGRGFKMRSEVFREETSQPGHLHDMVARYTQALMVQIAQGNACNNVHNIEQRAARWLLTTRDRVDSDTFPLTQEFLAQMLGVRRASVNVVAAGFKKKHMIEYDNGSITMLNRAALERVTCECYGIIREEHERLLD
ncbi:MAG TPA: Crp/Fnr family transcriptional regulator [Candidatus Binatia bacterium]|jgi:CRP-like cAMP-binding protein